jgi:fructose-specific PTS system IIB-like component
MAAESLESAAKAKGWQVKVETQGSIGIENELTAEDVASADMVILTKDIGIKLKSVLPVKPSCASISAMP